jgi:hypothetical protein
MSVPKLLLALAFSSRVYRSGNIAGEQSIFKRLPCRGYAIDTGPSGLAFLIPLALILEINLSLVANLRPYCPTFPLAPIPAFCSLIIKKSDGG